MYREEVTVLDALMAVYLTEINTDSNLLRAECSNPKQQYLEIVRNILGKLELYDILKREEELLSNN